MRVSRAVLKLSQASESPTGLVKYNFLRVSDPRIYISHKFPGEAVAAYPGTTLRTSGHERIFSKVIREFSLSASIQCNPVPLNTKKGRVLQE